MKVILLKNVQNVGQKYEIKNVSDGYALNFLIPNHLAEVAQASAVKKIEQLKLHEDLKRKTHESALHESLKKVEGQTLTTEAKVNDKGHLFKGIHKDEIAILLKEKAGVDVSSDYITLEKPIKEVGSHAIPLTIGDSMVQFTLEVLAEK